MVIITTTVDPADRAFSLRQIRMSSWQVISQACVNHPCPSGETDVDNHLQFIDICPGDGVQFRILRKTHHESDGPASSDMWFTWAMRQCLEPECTESWPESPDRASVIRQIWRFGPQRRVVVNHPNQFLICPDAKKNTKSKSTI